LIIKTQVHTLTHANTYILPSFIETKTILELIIEVFRDTYTLFRWLIIATPPKELHALVHVAFFLNKIHLFHLVDRFVASAFGLRILSSRALIVCLVETEKS